MSSGNVSVLEVENNILFARIVQSLHSGLGEKSLEPYSLWNEDGEPVKPKDALIVIVNPFDLPWNDRALLNRIYSRIECMMLEDEKVQSAIWEAQEVLSSNVLSLGLQLQSNYELAIEWEIQKYLKAFGFCVSSNAKDRLIDNLFNFLSLSVDATVKKPFVFVNLKTFLSKEELKSLYEQVIFYDISALLIENVKDLRCFEGETKKLIDLHLVQV